MEEMGVCVPSPSYYCLTGKRKIGIFWEEEEKMNLTFNKRNSKLVSTSNTVPENHFRPS